MPPLPLVSILIPAYNPRYFQEALHSALEQTYPNIEIIVCDDSADERIGEIATTTWKRPVHYEKNPVRLQGRGNYNKCISLAQGEYIKFLNDDDRLTRDCIAKLVAPLILFPELSLATSKRRRIDAEGNPLPDSESTLTPVTEDSRLRGPSVCRAILTSMTNFIGEPSTALVRRSALPPPGTDVLSYQGVPIRYLADVAMWFNALGQGDAVYLTEALSDFRVHGEQHQQTEDAGALALPNYRLLCRLGLQQGLIDAETAEKLESRPRMIPGWATLQFKPLQQTTGDWQEALLYFGPERIPKGASSAQLTSAEQAQYAEFDWQLYGASNPEGMHGGESWLTDHFLQHGQFEYRLGTPRYAHDANRFTRQCTKLWSQLLVDEAGQARPCPRFAPLFNIYEPGSRDGLDAARLHFLTGRPQGPCADCDLHPLVPLAPFVRHNFDADRQLLQARPGRVMVSTTPAPAVAPEHVLVVGHSAGRAGGEFVALTIVKALREERGCTVSLILARGGELVEEFRRYAQVYVVGEDLSGPEAVRKLATWLRLQGVRHAICNTVVVGRYASLLKGLGYQVTHLVHELGTSIERFLPKEDRLGVCDHTDTIVFPVRFVEASFLERYASRTTVLQRHPQGIEPDFPRPLDRAPIRRRLRDSLGLPPDSRLVIGAGSGELRKGPDLFIQVAKRILADASDSCTHFVWLGQLDAVLTSWIEHDRHAMRLDQRVHLAGLQSDLTDYYLGADVFLMTSREDPLPNVVIESMYAGLPVIAFAEGGGTPELLEEGCGVVVPYLDTDAMAAATRHLLDDPEAAQSIGKLAARRIETGFRRADYVDFLLSRFTAPVHRVTLVLSGQDAAELGQQLERLSASFDTIAWRPDALLLISPEAGPMNLPPALSRIRTDHLILPRDTLPAELLSQAVAQADTELLWFVDLPLERITDDLPSLLTVFDSPKVVAAFGPGHNPAQPEALAPIPQALLGLNERHWLKPHWLDEESAAPLARSTPVLALASGLLRRAAIKELLKTLNLKSKKQNPLWFWPLLVELSKHGTLAWTPRPTIVSLDNVLPGTGEEAPAWWEHWCQAQDAAAQCLPAASRPEQEQDRRQLRDALGLSIATIGKQKSGTRAVSLLSPQPAALSPMDELIRYNQAAEQLERGLLEKAQALLLDLAQQGSTLWQVYFDLGRIAFEREQTETAINHFRTAAGLEFSSTHALRNLIAIYTMTGEYGAALAATGLTLRRESDPELQAHLQAIVTEANVNLDSLDWASPKWQEKLSGQQEEIQELRQNLEQARRVIENLERNKLVGQFQKSTPYIAANKPYNKIFGIGYNKTGTTSLEKIFKDMGLNVPDQAEQEKTIVHELYLGNYEPLVKFVKQYDAFQDLPFSQGEYYAVADILFPNSKFILTIRDSEKWFHSLCEFHKKTFKVKDISEFNEAFFKDKDLYLYKNYCYENALRRVTIIENNQTTADWSLLYDKDYNINLYKTRNERIASYFRNRPDDLLIIDLEQEVDTEKIVNFLKLPKEKIAPTPHLNKTRPC